MVSPHSRRNRNSSAVPTLGVRSVSRTTSAAVHGTTQRARPFVLVSAITSLLLAGCAAKTPLTAEEHFQRASKEMHEGALEVAVEHYKELLDQHPFSEHSEEAELRIGHAYYLGGSCPEAIAAFTDFQRRHPTSPYLPSVGYMLGKCYQRQMRTPDRDQTASQNAHAYYAALKQQYPESPFADLAQENIEVCRSSLAEHELLVARFYESYGNKKATEYRLLDLVNRFNDTDAAGEALYALGQFYRKEGEPERAALAFAAVTEYHPNSGNVKAARSALKQLAKHNELPSGDPLVALKAETGRTRALAMAEVVDVPALEDATAKGARAPGFAPGVGTGPFGGGSGPFGGRY